MLVTKDDLDIKLLSYILFKDEYKIYEFNIDNDNIYYYIKEQIWDDESKYFRYIESDEVLLINMYQLIDEFEHFILKNDFCISMLISDDSVCCEIYNHNMIGGVLYKNMKDNKFEAIVDCINWILKVNK